MISVTLQCSYQCMISAIVNKYVSSPENHRKMLHAWQAQSIFLQLVDIYYCESREILKIWEWNNVNRKIYYMNTWFVCSPRWCVV